MWKILLWFGESAELHKLREVALGAGWRGLERGKYFCGSERARFKVLRNGFWSGLAWVGAREILLRSARVSNIVSCETAFEAARRALERRKSFLRFNESGGADFQ